MNNSANLPSASTGGRLAAAVPTLNSVSPASGAAGTSVTVTGTGFTGAAAVRFGTTAATSLTVLSDTQLTVTAPAGTGSVQVTVTTPSGTSSQFVTYRYTAASVPVLSSVSPASGPAGGGTTVTLTGTSLFGATAVQFGTKAATSFTVNSGTQITAVAPAGTGTVQVTVITPGGASAPGAAYFYVATPLLAGASPVSGPVAGGNTVTLTGIGLTGATAVTFGTDPAAFTVISDTQLTAVAPPSAVGTVQITVTTAGGTSTGASYTYLPTPSLTALSPASGPLSGGNTVTLTGTGLTGATAVTSGTDPAAFTVISDSQLAVQAPSGAAGPVNVTVTTPGGTSPALAYTRVTPPTI